VLVEARYQVRVLLRATSSRGALDGIAVEPALGDILDPASLARAMKGVDAVVHTAGLVSLRPRDRSELEAVNVDGARNVLDAAENVGARVIHTSSIATVGYTLHPDVRNENDWLDPTDAVSYPYAASKRESELYALEKARRGLDVVVVNPGYLLGPGDPHFSSTRLVLQYLQGEARFYLQGGISFADVRDVAEAYVSALSAGRTGERYILAGSNRSYRELFERLSQITALDRPVPALTPVAQYWGLISEALGIVRRHPYEELNLTSVAFGSRFNYCSSDKAARELGYLPRDIDHTLRATIVDHLRRSAAPARTPELEALGRSSGW
jgi:dihydroflavonol-4-reductase